MDKKKKYHHANKEDKLLINLTNKEILKCICCGKMIKVPYNETWADRYDCICVPCNVSRKMI